MAREILFTYGFFHIFTLLSFPRSRSFMKSKRISGCLSEIKLQPVPNVQASYLSGAYYMAEYLSFHTENLKLLHV